MNIRLATTNEIQQAVNLYPEMDNEGNILLRFDDGRGDDGIAEVRLDTEDPFLGWVTLGAFSGEGSISMEFDATGFVLNEQNAMGIAEAMINNDPDAWFCRETEA